MSCARTDEEFKSSKRSGFSSLWQRHQFMVPLIHTCMQLAALLLAGYVSLNGSYSLAAVLVESKLFISPKGAYVTEQSAYHTYRIPGMVVAADDSLLVFAEGRRGDGSDPRRDDNAPIDLVMRRSTDGGRNWQPQVVVDSGFKANGAKVDFGDPTPVLDQTTGDIFLLYGQWPDVGSIVANWGQDPDSSEGNHVTWVKSSSDHGVTWSAAQQIDYPDEPGESADGLFWRNAEPGPGSGIQLQWHCNRDFNGRLVIPAKRSASSTQTGTAESKGFVYYSDDHGATWQVGNVASAGGDENEVVELVNGDLLLDARANPRTRFTSSNGGNTWNNAPNSDIPVTTVDTSLIRYSAVRSGDDRNRLLHSGPGGNPVGSGSGRSNQLVWTSYDEGQTFINPKQFNSEQAAYSVLSRLNDGTIGMVVETTGNEPFNSGQNYGDITYYGFGINHLEGANHPATMSHYEGFGNAVDAFRGGVGWSGSWEHTNVDVREGTLGFPGFFTEDDDQHAHLRGAEMTRKLGVGVIDLDVNQDYYFSVFVRHSSQDNENESTNEQLEVKLLSEGQQQFAFGVTSTEALTVNTDSNGSPVSSADDTFSFDKTYLLLAKLAAQDSTSEDNTDQLYLAWYDDPATVPADPAHIEWQLVSNTSTNSSSTVDEIAIAGGAHADWSVDGLRIGTTLSAVIVDTGVSPPPVLGDFNGDLLIDIADWLVFRANMHLDTSAIPQEIQLAHGDLDNSGRIDAEDFVEFVSLYRSANGSGSLSDLGISTPEPDALLLWIHGLLYSVVGVRF